MFKQTALILGLGLSLSLTACAKAESTTVDQVQSEQSQPEPSKPESTEARRGPPGGREGRQKVRTPPEAAYTACASVALESTCTVERPRGTRTGTCLMRDGDDRAVCWVERLEGGRRPPREGQ